MKNKKYPHLMIDLETMGQGANAVICSIAAVPFHMDGTTGDYFSQNVDIQSCLDAGLKVDGSTIYWWMEQNQEARKALLQHRKPLPQVLLNLISFIGLERGPGFKIWGKGPSFDMGILADAYRACKLDIPWRYSKERCVRTELDGYEELVKQNVPFEGERHTAYSDAFYQILQVSWVQRKRQTTMLHGGDY